MTWPLAAAGLNGKDAWQAPLDSMATRPTTRYQ